MRPFLFRYSIYFSNKNIHVKITIFLIIYVKVTFEFIYIYIVLYNVQIALYSNNSVIVVPGYNSDFPIS